MTLTAVPGLRVGHAEVPGGGSGCTVLLGPFRGAVEVRGLATGTRELDALSPFHLVPEIHALLLTGGSAFGLAAADGVMRWLAERGEGFDVGPAKVPVVPAAVIFDLAQDVARPGAAEGYQACQRASADPVPEGRVGAGAGATVGKVLGPGSGSPGGVGSASRRLRNGTVGALAVVNALGDVVASDGTILAGARTAEGEPVISDTILSGAGFEGVSDEAGEKPAGEDPAAGSTDGRFGAPAPGANTTLVALATDLPIGRLDLGRLARMAAGAFPRALSPVNTPFDGDLLFVLSTGRPAGPAPPREVLALGVVLRQLAEEAIRRAVSVDLAESKAPSGDVS